MIYYWHVLMSKKGIQMYKIKRSKSDKSALLYKKITLQSKLTSECYLQICSD